MAKGYKCVTLPLVLRLIDKFPYSMDRDDELCLIERIRDGDDALYGVLVNKYSQSILSIVRGIVRNSGDAQEVAQDVFVKAFFSLKKFRGDSSFSTWLYRIAYNMSISRVRRKNIYVNVEDVSTFVSDSDMDGGEGISEKEEKEGKFRILDQVINELNPSDRFLILSFYIHDKSIKEISEITDISESNVKVRLHRIKRRLMLLVNNKD